MMSKVDYRDTADAIKGVVQTTPLNHDAERDGVSRTVKAVADAFKARNPRFRYDTFFEACGLNSWGDFT